MLNPNPTMPIQDRRHEWNVGDKTSIPRELEAPFQGTRLMEVRPTATETETEISERVQEDNEIEERIMIAVRVRDSMAEEMRGM
jgi:hypothetical protein